MKLRKFSDTKWLVSEIGIGCWAIGADWGNVNDEDARKTLITGFDNGVNFFDTADVYGDGRSEKFVGELIKSTSDRIYVATKAGRRLDPHVGEGYNLTNIEKFIDRSLDNLGVECIDLLQLHCPPTEVYSNDKTYVMLDTLVKKGKILHYGFSVETVAEARESIKRPNTKSIQIIFNMFRQKPSENFFQEAAKRNIAIIVRVPLASGMLTGKMNANSTFAENDHRAYNINGEAFDIGETFSGVNFAKGLEVVEELKKIIPENFSLSEFAIKWILMHPEVTVVIPGAKNKEQIIENIASSEKKDIKNLMQKISDVYKEYLKSEIHHRW